MLSKPFIRISCVMLEPNFATALPTFSNYVQFFLYEKLYKIRSYIRRDQEGMGIDSV